MHKNLVFRWIKNNRIEFLILLIILAVSALLRFYRLSEYMSFLGDEGRDALMVKRILTTIDLPFIGPPTSVGDMYLGPLYYYMMAIPMTIFWLNPVAAAGMVAIIGVATVGLIYYLSRGWFGKEAAIASSALYAISPVTILYSRSSWNPNPTPFFTLMAFLGLYLARKREDFKWFILTGVALAFAHQMHYLALILIPIFGLLWLYELYRRRRKVDKNFIVGSSGAIIIYLLLMSPLLLFDIKHNFMNLKHINAFFTSQDSSINLNALAALERIIPIYKDSLISRYMAGQNQALSLILSAAIFGTLLGRVINTKRYKKMNWPYLAVGTWLVVGVLGLSFYNKSIYDHYLGFLAPSAYILLGSFTTFFKNRSKIFLTILIIVTIGYFNLQKSPLINPPNNQLERTQEIAKLIIIESGNKPFNFALIAKDNYDSAYQFYLDIYGHKPRAVPFDVTEQLFVVCEDPGCGPIGHPKHEIAAFGWAKIDHVLDVYGVKIYKLVANPGGKPS